ncbi:MAG: hypothetical protein M3310_01625 [Actinomycetota bacterium]|nr:hypothetical protein [Actinomycetota bacterium]
MTAYADSIEVPRAVRPHPTAPSTNPVAITGIRPKRSMDRPAGRDVSAEAVRKIAGPSPRSDSKPVTSTKVRLETAATSWIVAELTAITVASRTVLRRIGRSVTC